MRSSGIPQHLDAWGIDSVDLVAGGVPCQPFSRPAAQDSATSSRPASAGHDARADLWASFVAVVEHLDPEAVLVENVPTFPAGTTARCSSASTNRCERSATASRRASLDGFRFGVPQHRQRADPARIQRMASPRWPEPSRRSRVRSATRSVISRRSREPSAASDSPTTPAGITSALPATDARAI